MKKDTKETIGSRGTVAGFRPLIGKERWHRNDFEAEMLEGGYRPLLSGEATIIGDQWNRHRTAWSSEHNISVVITEASTSSHHRTRRPLPSPQVETFEAHGHVWYRHVPGDACPVEPDVVVDFIWRLEAKREKVVPAPQKAKFVDWDSKDYMEDEEIIGYRFPDFPAVHTTLQQQQGIVQHVEKTEQSFQHDTTKQHLLTMYHGWCDVAPDSVAECIADVAKVLYPTDADRCEAEFQKWWSDPDGVDSDPTAIWHAAWNAAKQQKL